MRRSTDPEAAMSPTGRSRFQVETGRVGFELETSYKLLVPSTGEPPAGGWALVVPLHGMGMTADQFALILNGILDPGAVYLFPQGLYPYEIRSEGRIRIGYAWYLYDGHEEPFRTTLGHAEAHVLKIIDGVSARLPINPERVVLVGFSMGAYLGYFMGLRNSSRFQALVGIGGRMKEEFVADRLVTARRIPVLMVHGEKDRAVPLERALLTFETLKKYGFPVDLRLFPVGHQIRAVEVEAIREWLVARFGDAG
jgi:phospholipase/carboxylesterase